MTTMMMTMSTMTHRALNGRSDESQWKRIKLQNEAERTKIDSDSAMAATGVESSSTPVNIVVLWLLCAMSLPHPLLLASFQLLTSLFIPDSLANDRNRRRILTQHDFRRLAPRRAAVRCGDLILIRTPGRLYRYARIVADQAYDHVAVVMRNGMFLHIGPPLIRLLPVELILEPKRTPILLRPRLSADQTERFVTELSALIGAAYDTRRVYAFILRLAMKRATGVVVPLSRRADDTGGGSSAHICTDAIVGALSLVSIDFADALAVESAHRRLDGAHFTSFSISDVIALHHRHNTMLQAVPLPDVHADDTADETAAPTIASAVRLALTDAANAIAQSVERRRVRSRL